MKPLRIFLTLLFVSITAYNSLAQEERAFAVRPTSGSTSNIEAVTGQKFAFLVGVTEYEDSANFSTLTYTVDDVKACQKQLESIGFETGNIIVMASNTSLSRRPTKRNILANLGELLKKTGENDIVICMFSGHGAQIGKEQYFCSEDARADQLAESSVSLNEVMDSLKQSPAKFKWLIVDACRNDSKKSEVNSVKSLGKVESVPKGVTAIFSCAEKEYSFEDADLGHGVFTYFLLKGLVGEAADKNGDVTLLDLYKYVQKETSHFVDAKHKPRTQVPYWSGEFTNFILCADLNIQKANEAFQLAIVYRQKKDFDNATLKIHEAIVLLPNKPEFLDERQLIEDLQKVEKHVKAADYANAAVEFAKKREYTKANGQIDKAIELDTDNMSYRITKRSIEIALKRPPSLVEKASFDWKAAIATMNIPEPYPKGTGPKPNISLTEAIMMNNIEQVRRHIAHGTPLNLPNKNGISDNSYVDTTVPIFLTLGVLE